MQITKILQVLMIQKHPEKKNWAGKMTEMTLLLGYSMQAQCQG